MKFCPVTRRTYLYIATLKKSMRLQINQGRLKNFNKFIHLTNDAVQKRSDDYGRFEFGNKVSFLEYQ